MTLNISLPAQTKTKPRRWPPLQGDWTFEDYLKLPDNGMRYEVIEGELFMSDAPSPRHQEVILRLAIFLFSFVEDHHLGKLYQSPIDVVMTDVATPVQPDLLFIANERLSIVQEKRIVGVPNLVVEVLSPGTAGVDRNRKFKTYARVGVAEYWLVDPDENILEVYVLRGQAYALLGTFQQNDTISSEVLAELALPARHIFPQSSI